jgi:hypothetical protein
VTQIARGSPEWEWAASSWKRPGFCTLGAGVILSTNVKSPSASISVVEAALRRTSSSDDDAQGALPLALAPEPEALDPNDGSGESAAKVSRGRDETGLELRTPQANRQESNPSQAHLSGGEHNRSGLFESDLVAPGRVFGVWEALRYTP